jgi:hypothetical protein
MVTLPELINELKTLRKGRGLLASRIAERIGPGPRGVCDVTGEDGSARIRQKATEQLTTARRRIDDGIHQPANLGRFRLIAHRARSTT